MQLTTYSSAFVGKNCKKKSEAEITKELSWFLFSGQGDKYLGFRFADRELDVDGSWKIVPGRWDHDQKRWVANYDHPEHWTAEKSHNHWQCSALLKHLQGQFRGLVTTEDSGCTHVPFLASDLDRHHGENAYQHVQRVIKVGRLCKKMFPHLRWLVEVNLNNGSVKFFGFGRRCLPIERAREMAEELHQAVVQITGNDAVENFPHNLNQILLPFRTDKSTIISSGELRKVERWKNKPVRQDYTTYSMCEFEQWWEGTGQFDELTLRNTLKTVCQLENWDATSRIEDAVIHKPVNRVEELRDEAYREAIGLDVPQSSLSSHRSGKSTGINRGLGTDGLVSRMGDSESLDAIRQITNSFDRKRNFVQWLSRRLRRVPTVEEALSAYKEHKVYGGCWELNEKKRRDDFKAVVRYVGKGFDPALCGQNSSQRPELDEKIKMWSGRARGSIVYTRTFVATINQTEHVDEFGIKHISGGKRRWVSGKQLSVVMAIIDQVRKSDGGIPRDSVEGWWRDLAADGILPQWSGDLWIACRQILEQIGWIKVNHDYSHRQHQAKTCRITYGKGPLVGTCWVYPDMTINTPTTSIIVVTHPSLRIPSRGSESTSRPPPRGQPTPIRQFTPSFHEQISWN